MHPHKMHYIIYYYPAPPIKILTKKSARWPGNLSCSVTIHTWWDFNFVWPGNLTASPIKYITDEEIGQMARESLLFNHDSQTSDLNGCVVDHGLVWL